MHAVAVLVLVAALSAEPAPGRADASSTAAAGTLTLARSDEAPVREAASAWRGTLSDVTAADATPADGTHADVTPGEATHIEVRSADAAHVDATHADATPSDTPAADAPLTAQAAPGDATPAATAPPASLSLTREGAPTPPLSLTAPAPAPRARLALAHTAAITTTVATAVLAGLAGYFIPSQCYEAQGRPDPRCSGLGLLLGSVVQVGLAVLLVPETYRLANDAGGAGDIGASRLGAWRWGRWAALAGLIFVSTYLVGALVEKDNYGKGQAAMLVGAIGTLGSWITFDVTQLLGASAGYKESRRVRP